MILGIDPGYDRCGFAVMDPKGNLITSGVIKTNAKETYPERLCEIRHDFESLLTQFKPTVLCLEDLFFAQNTTTALKVAGVRGLLLCLAQEEKMLLLEPKPVEVKQSFTGDGKADKKAMTAMAKRLYGVHDKIIDDAVDAIAIAQLGLQLDRAFRTPVKG